MTTFRTPRRDRPGIAAVEFALCMPLILMLLFGIWEVGRIVEVQQVLWNATREGARQCSTGESDLLTIATNVCVYIQKAEPTTIAIGSSTPTYSMTSNGNTRTVTATSGNKTLYSLSFLNLTDGSRSDPTTCNQLDKYEVTLSMPYENVRWTTVNQITSVQNLTAKVDWYSMIDTPIVVDPTLPAQ